MRIQILGLCGLVTAGLATAQEPTTAETAWVSSVRGHVEVLLPEATEPILAYRGLCCPEGAVLAAADDARSYARLLVTRTPGELTVDASQPWVVGEETPALQPGSALLVKCRIEALQDVNDTIPPARGLGGGLRLGPEDHDPFLIAPCSASQLDPVVFLWCWREAAAAWRLRVFEEETGVEVWRSGRLGPEVCAHQVPMAELELALAVLYSVRLEALDADGRVLRTDDGWLERLDPEFGQQRTLSIALQDLDRVQPSIEDPVADGIQRTARGLIYAYFGMYAEAAARFLEAARLDPQAANRRIERMAEMLVELGVDRELAPKLAAGLVAQE